MAGVDAMKFEPVPCVRGGPPTGEEMAAWDDFMEGGAFITAYSECQRVYGSKQWNALACYQRIRLALRMHMAKGGNGKSFLLESYEAAMEAQDAYRKLVP